MDASLREIEAMVLALSRADQVQLLKDLLPRLAEALLASPTKGNGVSPHDPWLEFRRVGQRLAATPPHPSAQGLSLTRAVTDTRR